MVFGTFTVTNFWRVLRKPFSTVNTIYVLQLFSFTFTKQMVKSIKYRDIPLDS